MAGEKYQIQQSLHSLLEKFSDPDPDIRYMSLNDLHALLQKQQAAYLSQDSLMGSRVAEGLLKALEDQHGEVQNQALRCLGPLASRLEGDTLIRCMERLTNLTESQTIDTSVPNSAIRTLLAYIPPPDKKAASDPDSHIGYTAVSKVLIPCLVAPADENGMLRYDPAKGFSSDAIDVLIETVKLYGSILKNEQLEALQRSVMEVVENDHAGTVVIKRALVAISVLSSHLSDGQLSGMVSGVVESFRTPHLTLNRRRHLIAAVGSLAKAIPSTFGPYLKTLTAFVLAPVGEQEIPEMMGDESDNEEHDPKEDELRETAFVTLDTLLTCCASEMQPFLMDCVSAALRYLKFDPNVAEAEDEEMGGTQDESSDDGATEEPDDDNGAFDDFEEDYEGYSDIDDMSWKVRRCAAKVLVTAVVSQSHVASDATIYQRIIPALLARFNKEREENVKLEVLASMTGLVKKASESSAGVGTEGSLPDALAQARNSRKRRRQDSDVSFVSGLDMDLSVTSPVSPVAPPCSPTTGPQAEITKLTPEIIQGLTRLWKYASMPLKQSSILLLRALALVRYGGLADFLQQIEDPIADALKTSGLSGGIGVAAGAAVSAGNLQTETLSLISAICETHTSNALLPFLIALIPGIVTSVHDKNYKVSGEALGTIEQITNALTPPRISADNRDLGMQLEKLYDVVIDRIGDNNVDLEVRQRAIHVLGILLARTSGPNGDRFVSPTNRAKGLSILVDRLKNETTRLSASRAIDDIAASARSNADVTTEWVGEVTVELGSQLRKADRSLRGSSLEALKSLASNRHTRAHFAERTIQSLATFLLPLMSADDLHLLTPALVIFSRLIPTDPQKLVDQRLVEALCSAVKTSLAGTVLKAFLFLVRTIGEHGAGAPLMKAFLQDVGVSGEPTVVGRAIGTLLVHGGPNIGVQSADFQKELNTTKDDQRKCLALAILGEVGFCMGVDSTIDPKLFMAHFSSRSDKVRLSAAVALGNAGRGNIQTSLPVILEGMSNMNSTYLFLHSLKEILQNPGSVRADVAPFADRLWEILLTASDDEDNRAVGAECIGRLALSDPASYIPRLLKYLEHEDAAVRGTVISGFRYTLSNSSSSYNDILRPLIVQSLVTMLNDSELSNHRLAMTTVNSAIHNKASQILPHLGQLLPTIVADAHVKPELVREVQMGPFKHKVDDGLELRKSAYETLYTCLDVAFASINLPELFDRILAGMDDEQDIRALCHLMVTKLISLAPSEVESRVDLFCAPFRTILSTKLKESAVKQELEKAQEASTGVLKATKELQKAFPAAEASSEHRIWKEYVEWVNKEFKTQLKNLENGN